VAWFLVAFAIILFATLHPQRGSTPGPRPALSLALPRTAGGWLDVLQNVALYVPAGLALAGCGVPLGRGTLVAAGTSIGIELLQLRIPGRDPSSRDVLFNLTGTLLGYAVWFGPAGIRVRARVRKIDAWFVQARNPGTARASRLCVAWATIQAAIWLATGALLTPAIPGSGLSIASPYLDRSTGMLRIGNNGMPDGAFKGLIDEVRIYDHARTASQIREDMNRRVAEAPPHSVGLVAAFGFDASEAPARDDSGNGHDGTLRDAAPESRGRFGAAMWFDGVSSEVVVPYDPAFELRDGMTLEAWIRPLAGSAHEPAIIAHESSAYYLDESSTLGRRRSATGGRFGGMPRYARLGEPIPIGEWTHLAGTYDGQTIWLYVNGTPAARQVHWSPHRPESARLNDVELLPGDLPDANVLRTGRVTDLDIRFSCGARSDTLAPIFLIAGLHNTPVVELAAIAENLVLRVYTRANLLNLHSPSTQVPHVLAGCRERGSIGVRARGPLQNAAFTRDGEALQARVPGLGAAWAFIIPDYMLPDVLQLAATLAWLLLLAAPFGVWWRMTAISLVATGLLVAVYAAALFLLQVRAFDTLEYAAILTGWVFGRRYRGSDGGL
jgi:hypothetical protein